VFESRAEELPLHAWGYLWIAFPFDHLIIDSMSKFMSRFRRWFIKTAYDRIKSQTLWTVVHSAVVNSPDYLCHNHAKTFWPVLTKKRVITRLATATILITYLLAYKINKNAHFRHC